MRRYHWRFLTWGLLILGTLFILLSLQEEPPSPLILQESDKSVHFETKDQRNLNVGSDPPAVSDGERPFRRFVDQLADRLSTGQQFDRIGESDADISARLLRNVNLIAQHGQRPVGKSFGPSGKRRNAQSKSVVLHDQPKRVLNQLKEMGKNTSREHARSNKADSRPKWREGNHMIPRGMGQPLNTSATFKRNWIVYVTPIGGFGNQLFEIASGIGIALSTNRRPILSSAFDRTMNSFKMSLPMGDVPWHLPIVEDKHFATFNQSIFDLPKGDCILQGYLQSWKYFHKHEHFIRKHFLLKDHLEREAFNVKMKACSKICYKNNPHISKPFDAVKVCRCRKRVYIGVHVRRFYISPNYNAVPEYYLKLGMEYFRNRYLNPIFMVVSDEVWWVNDTSRIPGNDIYVVPQMVGEKHFAVLASCNHHVLSVGTYGWWAAWMAGGTTIYYGDPVPKSFRFWNEFTSKDFFPKHWIRMI